MASLKVQQKRARRSRLSKAKRKAHNIRQVRRREEEASKLNQQEMMQVIELVNRARRDPDFVMDEWEFRGSDKKVAAARALFEDMYNASKKAEEQEKSAALEVEGIEPPNEPTVDEVEIEEVVQEIKNSRETNQEPNISEELIGKEPKEGNIVYENQ